MKPPHSKSVHPPAVSGSHINSLGGEFVPYEDEYVQLNSSLQLAFNESLVDDVFTNTTTYKKVEVLMLSWEPKFDDLKVQGEIKQLKDVFESQFSFHVTTKQLERRERQRTQTQINRIVAEWVDYCNAQKTLLIVYFAGHGRPGKDGSLEIAGHKSPYDLRDYLDTVVWRRTESSLLGLDSDVLQIFDCCFAGITETRGSIPGASEFLAATGADDTTSRPGKQSFTTALIWALKELVTSKGRFTTSDLTRKICDAPDFPKDQKPVLMKRGESSSNDQQLIVLQPLQSEATRRASPSGDTTESPTASLQRDESGHDVVTIKFVFATTPTESDIRKLGTDMNAVVYKNRLKVHRIQFAGIRPKQNDMVFKAISRLRSMGQRSSRGLGLRESAASLIRNIENEVGQQVLSQIRGEESLGSSGRSRVGEHGDEFQDHNASAGALARLAHSNGEDASSKRPE